MNTIKKHEIIILFMSLILCSIIPINTQAVTYSDDRADVWFYFSWMEEDGGWHEWVRVSDENESILYETLSLKVGQPVKCKIAITPYDTCIVSYHIYEPGVTKCYDVIEGLNHNERKVYYIFKPGTETEYLEEHPETVVSYPNETIEYTWFLQTNEDGVGWNGVPLNCYWHVGNLYTYDDYDADAEVSFTYAKILDEQWAGPSYEPDDGGSNGGTNTSGDGGGTPGFELLVVLVALGFTVMFFKRKKQS